MGSSYRQDLKDGYGEPGLEGHLRMAAEQLDFAMSEASNLAREEDQFDNAADTGGLAALLQLALSIIKAELPKENRLCRKCVGMERISLDGNDSKTWKPCPACGGTGRRTASSAKEDTDE